MTISLITQRTFTAQRDPTSNDYRVTITKPNGSWDVVPNVTDFWNNKINGKLFQCTSLEPNVSAGWEERPPTEQGSFVPELQFGGASTGITYGNQSGNYVRVGEAVNFNIFISLTSKGTATGAATIVNLPFENGASPSAFTCYFLDATLSGSYTGFGARIAPSQQFSRLFEFGPMLDLNNLTDNSFQNDSEFFISGTYFRV